MSYRSLETTLVEQNIGAIEIGSFCSDEESVAKRKITIYDDQAKADIGWGDIVFEGTLKDLIEKVTA